MLAIMSYSTISAQEVSSKKLFELLSPDRTGIDFSNDITQTPNCNYLYYDYLFNGGGVAIGDINNDNLPDIYFTGNQVSNKLYLNLGDMKFKDITATANVGGWEQPTLTWSTGVTMADINGDGWLDIYICKSGPINDAKARKNELYLNNGDLTFTDVGESFGVADSGFTTHASFFDYDLDGDLDLYVLNHSVDFRTPSGLLFSNMNNPSVLNRVSGKLYRNEGGTKFTDVSAEAGILRYGWGLGVNTSDINNDGYPDIYVANDFSIPDIMFINNGDGTFTDKIKEYTKHSSYYSMGCDIADINNDAQPDIFVADMTASDHYRSKTLMPSMNPDFFEMLTGFFGFHYQYMFNSLQLNNGNNSFSDVAHYSKVNKTDWSWAGLIADFNNDGWNDILVTNGVVQDSKNNDFLVAFGKRLDELGTSIMPPDEVMEWVNKIPSEKIANFLFNNLGELKFKNVADEWGLGEVSFSNGAAYGDLDLDGDLDLAISNVNSPAFIYENQATELLPQNNYLEVKLSGDKMNPSGLNTKVYIYYDSLKVQMREQLNSRGFQSSVDLNLHFGIPSATIDSMIIQWNQNCYQKLAQLKTNQIVDVKKDCNCTAASVAKVNALALVEEVKEEDFNLDYTHKENVYNEFKKEILLPHKQSQLGPCAAVKDLNNDGLDDIYLGGAKGQSGVLYVQTEEGNFVKEDGPWAFDSSYEDIEIAIIDVNGDQNNDIYVVSGGGGDFEDSPELLQDRLYLNNGNGTFTKSIDDLPLMENSNACIRPFDIDGDGDLDLFIGGRIVPGNYPAAPRSYILENTNGKFKDITETYAQELYRIGLVNDALWTDFNNDGQTDLIVTGEWMSIRFFKNDNGKLVDVSNELEIGKYYGWWNTLEQGDFDNDGDIDYIAGNIGKNNKFHPSFEKPLDLYLNDFDANGINDIVLATKYKGHAVPVRGRECSSAQMPYIAEKFASYQSFATASLEDIYGDDMLANGLKYEVNYFGHVLLKNMGNGKFDIIELPYRTQLAPINDFLIMDFNEDGFPDIMYTGNRFGTEVETQAYNAGIGGILINNGKGEFENLLPAESGFYTPNNARKLNQITVGKDRYIVVTNNNDKIQLFKINSSRLK